MIRSGSRIARRYRLVLGTFSLIVAIAYGATQAVLAYRAAEEDAVQLQESELRSIAVRIDTQLASVIDSVVQACRLPWSTGYLSPAVQREEYRRLIRRHPEIVEVQGSTAAGREIAFVSRMALDRLESGLQLPSTTSRGGKRGVEYDEVYFKDGLSPFLRIACSERSAGTGVRTSAEVNLEFVSEAVAASGNRLSGDAFVVDERGRFVAHSRPSMVFSGDNELLRAAAEAPLPAPDSVASRWIGPTLRGHLVSVTVLDSGPWRIGVAQRAGAVLAPAHWMVGTTFAVALVLGAVALLIAYHLAGRLTEPIRRLGVGAQTLGRGDLAHRIEMHSGDEIEDVAHEINRMAEQLQGYTTGLERKVAEQTAELRSALDLAREAMRGRAVFLAAASHDLRQPLYAISILADALATESLPGNAGDLVAQQRRAIAVLRGLFNNLLDLSRFDAGEIRVSLRHVSLKQVLGPVAAQNRTICRAKGLVWRSEIPDVPVLTDPVLLPRLLDNLLSNAIRYTEKGSVVLGKV